MHKNLQLNFKGTSQTQEDRHKLSLGHFSRASILLSIESMETLFFSTTNFFVRCMFSIEEAFALVHTNFLRFKDKPSELR